MGDAWVNLRRAGVDIALNLEAAAKAAGDVATETADFLDADGSRRCKCNAVGDGKGGGRVTWGLAEVLLGVELCVGDDGSGVVQ